MYIYIIYIYIYIYRYICIFIYYIYIYMLIKTEYTVIFSFKNVSTTVFLNYTTLPLREKCPNTEIFLVRIFLYSVGMLVKKILWRCTSLCCHPLTVFVIIPFKAESLNSRAYILYTTCFTREQVDNTFTVTIKFVIYFVTLLYNKTLKNVCIVNI